MAYFSQSDANAKGFWDAINDAVWGLIKPLAMMSSVHGRIAQIERLTAKSDEELAQMGLRREDIVQVVFRDMYHT